MATTHNLENYKIRETDGGNFEIVKPDGTVVIEHDDLNDVINLIEKVGVNDLTDATSGATVYDSSTEELTADVNNQSASTDRLATESRGPTFTITEESGTYVATGESDTEIASGSDAATVFSNLVAHIDALSPKGGRVHFGRGVFNWGSQVTVNTESLTVTGAGGAASRINPTTTLTSAFDVREPAGTITNGTQFRDLYFAGANLTYGIEFDSVRDPSVVRCTMDGDATLIHGQPDEAAQNLQALEVLDCRGYAGGQIGRFEAGAAATHDLINIERCYSFSLSGWAIELLDGTDFNVQSVGAFNNGGTFDGCVRVAATGNGTADDVIGGTVRDVSLENQDGTNAAEAVVTENAGGTDNVVKQINVGQVEATPANAITYLRVENKDATADRVTHITFEDFANRPTNPSAINIVSTNGGVRDINIEADLANTAAKLQDVVSLGGQYISLNGVIAVALAGTAPNATNYEIGDKVKDTDNAGDVYLVYDASVSGGVTQIGT